MPVITASPGWPTTWKTHNKEGEITQHTWTLLVGTLAVNQIVEVLRHSELFEGFRERHTRWLDDDANSSVSPWLWQWHKLWTCPWCLSVWIGSTVAAWLAVGELYGDLWTLPLQGLAMSRLANLINDGGYAYSRTPKIVDEHVSPEP